VAPVSDRITLRGMRFLGRHGVTLEERLEPQPIEVDVELETDLAAAAASDDLANTIDYSAVFEVARAIVEERSFRLIEALAGEVADAVLAAHAEGDPPLGAVEVRVRKPQAPLPGTFETVEVSVRRVAGAEPGGSTG
jgi:dihydroneopterin aldolase